MSVSEAMSLPPYPTLTREDLKEFSVLSGIAKTDAGLVIPVEKAPMLFARLNKRLRALGMSSRSEYCRLVSSPDGKSERRELISTLTTNVTSFFRENHHFESLSKEIETHLVHKLKPGGCLRFWSAGCSTGQEAYSIAMVVLENIPDALNLDIRILATDIDSNVLSIAREGVFGPAQIDSVSPSRKSRFFQQDSIGPLDKVTFKANDELKTLITFRNLNLLENWPMKRGFDAIFCRNVVIYFDKATQNSLWPRFENACLPGGHLFLGHSERLDELYSGDLQACGTTTYRRTAKN